MGVGSDAPNRSVVGLAIACSMLDELTRFRLWRLLRLSFYTM